MGSNSEKTQSEKDVAILKTGIAMIVIFVMLLMISNNVFRTLSLLDVTADFTNARMIHSAIKHSILLKNVDENIGHVAVSENDVDEPVDINSIYPQIVDTLGEIPNILAQPKGTLWRVVVNVDSGIVKVYAGDVQLEPNLSKYELPYSQFFVN